MYKEERHIGQQIHRLEHGSVNGWCYANGFAGQNKPTHLDASASFYLQASGPDFPPVPKRDHHGLFDEIVQWASLAWNVPW